ncbi:MAG: DsrE family protein [Candidatus Sericytochromatia bacterium]|nr:DsrE family protein [Candidatus Sericytochromatia bacterium]
MKKYIFKLLPLLTFALSFLFVLLPVNSFSKPDIIKVVFQVNDKDHKIIESGFKNLKNMLETAKNEKQELLINVVVFGLSMKYFTKDSPENFSDVLSKYTTDKNIKFLACNNTMKQMKLTKDNLLTGFSVVPSGAWEVIKLQKQGYQYFKP